MNHVLDDILPDIELKSAIPEVAEQLLDMDARRSYFVCTIRGSANTKRDLKKLLDAQPLAAGEYIIIGREVQVTKRVKVEYDFA